VQPQRVLNDFWQTLQINWPSRLVMPIRGVQAATVVVKGSPAENQVALMRVALTASHIGQVSLGCGIVSNTHLHTIDFDVNKNYLLFLIIFLMQNALPTHAY
jgi:hypothetical protein